MSQPSQTLTCPAGHTFPREQLTYREGLSVCPICDRVEWAVPRPTWSRRLLAPPLALLVGAAVMFLVEAISGIGIGADYQHIHVSGAGWLVAGSAVAVAGVAVAIVGIIRLATTLRSQRWVRSALAVPLAVIAVGAAILAVGDVVDLGLNIAFVNASDPGAGWQVAAQVFDTLFFAGLAAALFWAAALTRRPDPIEPMSTPNLDATAEPSVSSPLAPT
jgi:hypothetical protein